MFTKIREEILKDKTAQKLAKRIARGGWDNFKRDKDIQPYYQVRQELSDAKGLVFLGQRTVLPEVL
mgnify:CR=1 FL=1